VFGSCHAIELGFVFGSHSLKGPDNFFGKGDVADAINRSMMQAWASFASSGAPVIDGNAWPQRNSDQPKHVVFGGGNAVASAVEAYTRETAWRDLPDSRVGV
jgi:para-nitrobenzyl esterase